MGEIDRSDELTPTAARESAEQQESHGGPTAAESSSEGFPDGLSGLLREAHECIGKLLGARVDGVDFDRARDLRRRLAVALESEAGLRDRVERRGLFEPTTEET